LRANRNSCPTTFDIAGGDVLKGVSLCDINHLRSAGPDRANPLFLKENKNDNSLKTLETIFALPLDFWGQNAYIYTIERNNNRKKIP